MSYCRFENTYRDLTDCVGALEDGEKLSASEKRYAKRMRDLCEEYIELFNEPSPDGWWCDECNIDEIIEHI